MSVILNLTPETERRLKEKAARNGQTLEVFLQQLVEREANGSVPASGAPRARTVEELLAPVRDEFEKSGMTEEELTEFLTDLRDQVRQEKRAGTGR